MSDRTRWSGSLQWGRDFSVAEGGKPNVWPISCRSFNGAATLVSRKAELFLHVPVSYAQLQWGRDFSVAEGDGSVKVGGAGLPASMGPRL